MRATTLTCLLLAAASPSSAQIAGTHRYDPAPAASPFLPDSRLAGPGIGREVAHMRRRIDRARDAGLISRREARRLDREARLIRSMAYRFARDGLSASERRELESRSRALDGAIGARSTGR